jgi:hypothetical protein
MTKLENSIVHDILVTYVGLNLIKQDEENRRKINIQGLISTNEVGYRKWIDELVDEASEHIIKSIYSDAKVYYPPIYDYDQLITDANQFRITNNPYIRFQYLLYKYSHQSVTINQHKESLNKLNIIKKFSDIELGAISSFIWQCYRSLNNQIVKNPIVLILTGASGGGKSLLAKALCKVINDRYFSIKFSELKRGWDSPEMESNLITVIDETNGFDFNQVLYRVNEIVGAIEDAEDNNISVSERYKGERMTHLNTNFIICSNDVPEHFLSNKKEANNRRNFFIDFTDDTQIQKMNEDEDYDVRPELNKIIGEIYEQITLKSYVNTNCIRNYNKSGEGLTDSILHAYYRNIKNVKVNKMYTVEDLLRVFKLEINRASNLLAILRKEHWEKVPNYEGMWRLPFDPGMYAKFPSYNNSNSVDNLWKDEDPPFSITPMKNIDTIIDELINNKIKEVIEVE